MNHYWESKKFFQTFLLGAGVGILDLIPLDMKSFHTEATYIGLCPGGRGELLGGYICTPALLGKAGHSLLICYHAECVSSFPFWSFCSCSWKETQLKGVVMDQEQLGSLMICQQLTAKFQHPEVMMGVGEDSEGKLTMQYAESPFEIWWCSYWVQQAGERRRWGRLIRGEVPLQGWLEGKQMRSSMGSGGRDPGARKLPAPN